jgi:ATP-dependent Lon protease
MPETSENTPATPETPTGEQQAPTNEDLRFSTQPKGEPFEVAVLPLQNLTVFPETVVPLGIGRPRSIAAVELLCGQSARTIQTPSRLICMKSAR